MATFDGLSSAENLAKRHERLHPRVRGVSVFFLQDTSVSLAFELAAVEEFGADQVGSDLTMGGRLLIILAQPALAGTPPSEEEMAVFIRVREFVRSIGAKPKSMGFYMIYASKWDEIRAQ